MTRVRGPQDVPDVPHYAVIIYSTTSVYVPGDERSRTNPGHGYPEHTETSDTFEHWVTKDASALEAFVVALEEERKSSPYTTSPYVFFNAGGKGSTETRVTVRAKAL
jgi:hypothetical protein